MRLRIDRESGALCLHLGEAAVEESLEVEPGIVVDFDAAGRLVGIEVLTLSGRTDTASLQTFHRETTQAAPILRATF